MYISAAHGTRVPRPEAAPVQSFGYLFLNAPEIAEDADIGPKFEALAGAMAEARPLEDQPDAVLAPIFTYLGQFIDHDITLNTDSDNEASIIGDPNELLRQPRGLIVANVANGRDGTLALDSLYGGAPNQTAAGRRLQQALRDGPRMRLGPVAPVGVAPDLPQDRRADLPRIGSLLSDGVIAAQDLPPELRPANPQDPKNARAFVGDGRNDENLIIAQLQVAFLRFHNAVVDRILAESVQRPNDEEVFRLARQQVIWTYQWLVVNEFLPAICPPAVVDAAIRDGAPVYQALANRFQQHGIDGVAPMPLEFSVAAFRYGHTMVRDAYDYNLTFGRSDFDVDDANPPASLRQLFEFTGKGAMGGFGLQILPQNWIIEWRRFVSDRPLFRDRLARAIDTNLAPNLFDLVNEDQGVFRNLALRNLRRGYNMNIASGQAVLAELKRLRRPLPRVIQRGELTRGPTGRALRDAGLADETPLWFYVLKEAEETQRGARLGAVGGTLVAETLLGLIMNDGDSYWRRPGSGPDGRWHPRDGVQPLGRPVVSIARLLESAGVLERA